MTGWLLILILLVLGGVLSTLGDRLGSSVGKARLSLLGLRPRSTAVVITVLTGSLISALSLGLLLLVSRQLRVGLFELNALQEKLRISRSELERSREAQAGAARSLSQAQRESEQARLDLTTAKAKADALRQTLVPLQKERQRLEAERQRLSRDVQARDAEIQRTENELADVRSRISKGEAELRELEQQRLALRLGNVVLSSGQPLATATLRLDRPNQAKQVIDQLLREANLQAYQRVLPGETPDRQILLVPRNDIQRLESTITKPGTWVVNIRSAANVLLGEEVVYAFPEVRPNTTVVQRDAVLARTALERDETNSEAVRNRLNLLLASALAEAQRRGSLVQGLQFDTNALNQLGSTLLRRSPSRIELKVIANQRSDTADPVIVRIEPVGTIPQARINERRN
ncbi:DUF3084 domain-containing protein [Synechococcus sp. RS9916]|uniref:DUF3084 domain-containing protein n=1 Tax=Synechococcus sp. RS9916 TaxID=221359 RepID=UPI0000E547EC|nr:DUF3084 domain-containing protein [Synechococcus sp. RS9916]EAU72696.1 hypothetical protein RS9916_39211 [Synechococcus sp. RS9916]